MRRLSAARHQVAAGGNWQVPGGVDIEIGRQGDKALDHEHCIAVL